MKIYEKEISELKPYENNPRKNNQAVDQVAASIKEFGFKVPCIISKDGTIIAGHTRYKAALKLGLKSVPCVIADDLTEEQQKALRLVENKTNELAEWNIPKLDLELMEIEKIDMSTWFQELAEDEKAKTEKESMLESMELKAFEHYDYLVVVFDNQMDWLNVVNMFGLHKVNAGYGKTKKIGVGRVVTGKRFFEAVRHKDFDIEQGEKQ